MTVVAETKSGVHVYRVELSLGPLDLLRFVHYDHAFPRHSHEEFTLGVFETGNGSLGYRGSRWRAADGTILAVPPDEVHTAEPLTRSGWTYRAMYPSARLVATALGQSRVNDVPAFFRRPIFDDAVLADGVGRAHRMLVSGGETLAAETLLLTTLHTLVARHGAPIEAPRAAAPIARVVAVARAYLQAHYAESVKLAALAAACEVSPFHMIRSFRDVTGIPPHAYLTQIRAHRARAMLIAGESLVRTAYACGFCDQSHLTRTFKRIFGVTPGAYAVRVR